jgi:hypothetical protein
LHSGGLLREADPDKRRAMDCMKVGVGAGCAESAADESEEETSFAGAEVGAAAALADESCLGGAGG